MRFNGKDNKAQVQKVFHRYIVLCDQFAFWTRLHPFISLALVSFASFHLKSGLLSRSLSFSHLKHLDALESAETALLSGEFPSGLFEKWSCRVDTWDKWEPRYRSCCIELIRYAQVLSTQDNNSVSRYRTISDCAESPIGRKYTWKKSIYVRITFILRVRFYLAEILFIYISKNFD